MKDCTRRDLIAGMGLSALALLALQRAGSIPALAAGQSEIHVSGAWARPSIGSTGRSVAYFAINNSGSTDDRLSEAKGAVSEKVELHRNIKEGDIMRMRPVKGGVEVPAGKTVTFEPAGLHVMLIGLSKPLKQGDTFPLTLVFEKAGEIKVDVAVKMTAGNGGHMHHKH